ncbi:MAG: putative Ak7-A-prov protein [Streblomastix strix]|uniref:Putative Ak7-A-prov protein n=1 Tax=Streblomastix strix TaxID=222440 RepID=A0A5J4W360_9EUKA|nr:MAG: putative Ak7-A-prov protein [Streblomastix strix]
MKILIAPLDTYLGRHIYEAFAQQDKTGQHVIVGMRLSEDTGGHYERVQKFLTLDNLDDFRNEILSCDVFVLDIEYCLKAAHIVKDVLEEETFYGEKTVVVISSYLTWAQTVKTYKVPEEEEEEAEEEGEKKPPPKPKPVPFTEADKRKREAHEQFKEYLEFEKMIMRDDKAHANREHVVVLVPGILYGDGEDVLHPWFKMAWHGEPDSLPIFGENDGGNYVPTIHVQDMSNIVVEVSLKEKQRRPLILCVDKGVHTQSEIAGVLARVMGTGRARGVGPDGTLLNGALMTEGSKTSQNAQDDYPKDIDLHLESPYAPPPLPVGALKNTPITKSGSYPLYFTLRLMADVPLSGTRVVQRWKKFHWHCADILRGMGLVVREFKRAQGLEPLRIFIHGPPGVGKTTLAQRISLQFKIEHVNVKKVIDYYKDKPSPVVQQPTSADGEVAQEGIVSTSSLQDAVRTYLVTGNQRIPDGLINKMMREYLIQRACRAQGFVLEGYPRCLVDARELWTNREAVEEARQESGEQIIGDGWDDYEDEEEDIDKQIEQTDKKSSITEEAEEEEEEEEEEEGAEEEGEPNGGIEDDMGEVIQEESEEGAEEDGTQRIKSIGEQGGLTLKQCEKWEKDNRREMKEVRKIERERNKEREKWAEIARERRKAAEQLEKGEQQDGNGQEEVNEEDEDEEGQEDEDYEDNDAGSNLGVTAGVGLQSRSGALTGTGLAGSGSGASGTTVSAVQQPPSSNAQAVASSLPPVYRSIFPTTTVLLNASDEFLRKRIMSLPEVLTAGTHNDESGLERRLRQFHESNNPDNDIRVFMRRGKNEERRTNLMEVSEEQWSEGRGTADDEGNWGEIKQFIGEPHNYGPTHVQLDAADEVQEELDRQVAAHRAALALSEEVAVRAIAQKREAVAKDKIGAIQKAEAQMLANRSKGLHTFLRENVMPTLTRGLMEVAQVRPEDPIEYLAEYIFRHTPDEDTETAPFATR